jgi:fructuronate reductase
VTPRLGAASVLPAAIQPPAYTPEAHGVGIVHLGLGAFHRAHQAVYVDDLLGRHGGDWRILGVSLRSAAVRDQLVPQAGRYTLAVCDAAGEQLRLIGAIAGVLVAPEDPAAVIAAIARPQTAIVSLTITEKGYCHDPATGALDAAHPDIVHDLAVPERPRSAVGLLVAGLAARRLADAPPLTLLSCDNLPENGALLRRILLRHAALIDPALADWIAANTGFPSAMVDRIVPAATAADIARSAAQSGFDDRATVRTEPFTQWVIEDRFAGPRPRFEAVGVQLVDDVRPFELAKLRMLNGCHSALAYLGLLAGYDFVHQAVADPSIAAIAVRLMRDDVAPTLGDAIAPGAYADALMTRFANPALAHRLVQIAMDGSQKLPQRLLGTIANRLAAGAVARHALLGVAAWILHASGRYRPVDDPLVARFAGVAAQAGNDAAALVDGMLAIDAVFAALPRDARLVAQLVADVAGLQDDAPAHLARVASA